MEKEKTKKKIVKEKSVSNPDVIINNKKYSERIKYNLIYINDQLVKIHKYGYNFPNIIIDNANKKELELYKEAVVDLFKYYDKTIHIETYNDDIRVRNLNKKDSVLVIDDVDCFLDGDEYDIRKIIEYIDKEKISVLFLTDKNAFMSYINADTKSNYYKLLNTINSSFTLTISSGNTSISEIYNEVMNELNNRNIILEIEEDKVKYIIHELIEGKDFSSAGCATNIVDDFTKLCIVNDTNTITADDIELLYDIDVCNTKEKEKSNINNEIDIKKMIGLKSVKEEIESLKNYLSFIKKLNKQPDKTYLNMFFLGNPGTGKTTVARLFKDILYNLGYIKENKMVEVVPNDFTGQHVGETRYETRKILDKAKGGLLFIDEAYLLYTDAYYKNGRNPYMEEAMVELIKYLEDPTNVVIFAGYSDELRNIYKANTGLKSRIFKEIEFPDYTNEELYKILVNNLSKYDLKIDKGIKKEIMNLLNEQRKNKAFGNARYIEKLVQVLINNHANRKLKEEKFLIELADMPKKEENKIVEKIGFIGD